MISQALLGLKNDSATIQLHFLSGSLKIGHESLFEHQKTHLVDGIFRWSVPFLKMNKRMSFEKPEKLTYLQTKMFDNQLSCTMIAIPCGSSEIEVQNQTERLQKFIEYLSVKHYAGIIEIPRR